MGVLDAVETFVGVRVTVGVRVGVSVRVGVFESAIDVLVRLEMAVPVAFDTAVSVMFAIAVLVKSTAAVPVSIAPAVFVNSAATVPVRFAAAVEVNKSIHRNVFVLVLRGVGGFVTKSILLLLVSVHPLVTRISDNVAFGAGALSADDVPSLQLALAPYPIRSTILGSVGQVPLKDVVVLTRATLPASIAIFVVLGGTTSDAGKETPFAPPDPS